MASNEGVLVDNAVSKVYNPKFISTGIRTFLNEHFQLVQFHLKPYRILFQFLILSILRKKAC